MIRAAIASAAVGLFAVTVVAQERPIATLSGRTLNTAQTPVTRAATAGMVILGKVVSIEKEEIETPTVAGSSVMASYRVAVVQIEDGLSDVGGQTHLKVGFLPNATGARGGVAGFEFTPNAAGLFILGQHHSGSFYVSSSYGNPIDVNAKTYKDDLANVKKTLAAIADPVKALKNTDAKERYFAAAVLVLRYKTSMATNSTKTVPVSVEESKLILQAIADADWAETDKTVPAPYQTFMRLGLTAKDKWQPAAVAAGGNAQSHLHDEFKKWLAADGEKYQLTKFAAK